MTSRPAFFPRLDRVGVDDSASFEFSWNPGFAFTQKQKNVRALHDAIRALHPESRPLEISSKSTVELGVNLSAFNLGLFVHGAWCVVESVYQASKVFQGAVGPFPDFYDRPPKDVRNAIQEYSSLPLMAFEANGVRWPLTPTRAFYDWIYIKILMRNGALADKLGEYTCYTDIEFNPKRSLNCQAYACALYVSLKHNGVLKRAMSSQEEFLKIHPPEVIHNKHTKTIAHYTQRTLGFS